MSTMGRYCKAYPASMLRRFPGWKERPLPEGVAIPLIPEDGTPSPDDDVCYFIQENLVVTGDVFMDEHIVFDDVTPEWEHFCRTDLEFEVPESELPEMPTMSDAVVSH